MNVAPDVHFASPGASELLATFGGASFEGGLYRLFAADQVPQWTQVTGNAFPEYSGRISSFGSDWLGRIFAVDSERIEDDQPGVLMFEPGAGQVLEIPANFLDFHCNELIESPDAALAREMYFEWRELDSQPLSITECVGYEAPLFLGGSDTLENMKRGDMDVYWEICAQLLAQIR